MFSILRQNLAKVVFVIVLIVLLSGVMAFLLVKFGLVNSEPSYSVVYLETGEIYFGELLRLPFVVWLKNAYVLQRGQNGELSVLPLSATIWQPQGVLRLNPSKIVFTASISKQSLVYQTITRQTSTSQSQVRNSQTASSTPETSANPSPILTP